MRTNAVPAGSRYFLLSTTNQPYTSDIPAFAVPCFDPNVSAQVDGNKLYGSCENNLALSLTAVNPGYQGDAARAGNGSSKCSVVLFDHRPDSNRRIKEQLMIVKVFTHND